MNGAPPRTDIGLRAAANFLVVALGVWLALRSARYVAGSVVMRFQVETAALLFAAVGLTVRVERHRRGESPRSGDPFVRLPYWVLPLCWLAAIVVYASTLRIGFLSDDFVLADRAETGRFGVVSPELFRPFPLLVWGAILNAGGGPIAVHVLNGLLHGTNAYLAARLVEPYVRNPMSMLFGSAIVLAFPLSPEAVAWSSGVFDLMATTFSLTGILVVRRYGAAPSVQRRAALYACAALALLSKETAAVLPLLILLDTWAARRWGRAVTADVFRLALAVAAIAVVRLRSASPVMTEPITKFTIQRWLFDTFGSAAFPWHQNVLQVQPVTVLVGTLVSVTLIAMFFLSTGTPEQTRAVVAMTGVMLVGTLPVIQMLGVAPDLQGARYLYLPGVGWAGLIACITAPGGTARLFPRVAGIAAAVLIATYAMTLPVHLAPWHRAAELRDRVERAALTNPLIARCESIHISILPDNVEGAYVLRNGAREAFRRDIARELSPTALRGCSFTWDAERNDFVPATR